MTVLQLKAELSERNLDASGKKAELVQRLEEYEKENGPAETAENGDGETEETVKTDDIIEQLEQATQEEENDGEANEAAPAEGQDAEAEGEETEGKETKQECGEEGEETTGEEVKQEAGEEGADAPAEGEETKEEKEEVKKDEGPDITKIAKGFCLALDDGKKIVIPVRENIRIDLRQHSRVKTVVCYPVKVTDLADNTFQELFETCVHFSIVFQEHHHEKVKSENGYLELRFESREAAEEAAKKLAEMREDLKVKACGPRDMTNQVIADLKGEDEKTGQETSLNRQVYIGNLPPTATEQALEALIPDAIRVAVIVNEENIPKGYALADFPTEELADRAVKMYHSVEFEEKNLIVLKAWFKPPKGLLDAATRSDLLRKVRMLKNRIKGNKAWAYNPLQKHKAQNVGYKEMDMYKQRLDRDCTVRGELGLPVPPDVLVREQIRKELAEKAEQGDTGDEKKEGEEAEKEGDDKKDKTTPQKKRNDRPQTQPRKRFTPSGTKMRGGGSWSGNTGRTYNQGMAPQVGMAPQGGGGYNQAMKMLMQVSQMLTTSGQNPNSSMGGGGGQWSNQGQYSGGSGYGYGNQSSSGASSYGNSGYGNSSSSYGGGYGGGYGANKQQRRW